MGVTIASQKSVQEFLENEIKILRQYYRAIFHIIPFSFWNVGVDTHTHAQGIITRCHAT